MLSIEKNSRSEQQDLEKDNYEMIGKERKIEPGSRC
jgi:hypothetical protein